MRLLYEHHADLRIARFVYTDRSDGDLSPAIVPPATLAERRHAVVPLRWAACRQIHSDRVVEVDHKPSERPAGDSLHTRHSDVALAVHSGDCVTVGFACAGSIAVAHAGWKGLLAGVLESTVRSMRSIDNDMVAVVGPHIQPDRYEFGQPELAAMVDRFGSVVAAQTVDDTPALDLGAAVGVELRRLGVPIVAAANECTSDAERFWSHRARSESGRIAFVGWLSDD